MLCVRARANGVATRLHDEVEHVAFHALAEDLRACLEGLRPARVREILELRGRAGMEGASGESWARRGVGA